MQSYAFWREKNKEHEYTMKLGERDWLRVIEKSFVERDLGIMVSSDFKWVTQVEKATKTAKKIIAQIKNNFSYFDAELVRFCILLKSFVLTHFDYCSTLFIFIEQSGLPLCTP